MLSEEGFTLVETLIAMAILAGVAASVAVSFQLYGSRSVQEERSSATALLARSVLEDFDTSNITAQTTREGEVPGGGRWTLVARSIGPERGLRGVVITVTASVGRGQTITRESASTIRLVSRPR